jgi:uncharacterized protein
MKSAIIVHGKPERKEQNWRQRTGSLNSKAHWLGWLANQLKAKGFMVKAPEMPHPDNPKWEEWSAVIDRLKIDKNTLLIGHSCGAGFWVKYLSLQKNIKPGKVILVAPWLDPDGNETQGFFDNYQLDAQLSERTSGLIIFNSDNDMGNVLKSVAELRNSIKNVQYKEFHKYGHFTYQQMGTKKFPKLLDECLKGHT